MNQIKQIIVYTALLFLTACQTTSHLKPMQNGPVDQLSLSDGEKRLWSMSEDAEQQIRRSGKIMKLEKAQKSLQQILDKLYPDQIGNMKIAIIKRPILNAFAFPNGSIYIHTGIISAARNEAQIAAVIAHEGAHYILKHSAKSRIKRNNMTSFALMVNLMGIPLLGELIGISSVSGYSQDLEREADMMGAKRMLAAGYDINESYKIFEFMASEAKANEIEEPFFFASHPKLQERILNFKKFALENKSVNNSNRGQKRFKNNFKKVQKYALHKKLEIGRYSSLINELNYDANLWDNLPLAEDKIIFVDAYRLRGRKGDYSSARQLIANIISTTPEYWKSYFSLGIIDLKEKKFTEAKNNLLKAQSLTSIHNGYIKMYLKKLKKYGE